MGIVFITLPGAEQRAFAKALHEGTGGGVDLVLVKRARLSSAGRSGRIYKAVRSGAILQELWYGTLLRLSRKTRKVLAYLRASSTAPSSSEPELETLEVEDINSREIEALLKRLSPELIVVWCSAILKPNILETAKKTINFHTGILPYYRGSVANQFAVLRRDVSRIGSTIHYVTRGVDRGDIIMQLYVDTKKRPREAFLELNNDSLRAFIAIAKRILAGEEVPGHAQNQTEGEFFRLSQWTNKMRWMLGRQLVQWEKTGTF